MDVHNISYLHDDNAPQDSMPENNPSNGPKFLTKRNLIITGIIGIFLISTTVITLNITNNQSTITNAESETETARIPTPKPVIIEGTINCIDKTKEDNLRCELALKTDDGKEYKIDNAAEKGLIEGQRVKVGGTVVELTEPTGTLNLTGNITVNTVQSPSSKTPSIPPNPTSPPQQSQSLAPTFTPTPTPQLKNNNPTPGVEYLTVKYVVDNKETLNNQTVNVGAFLVGGYIGRPGCDFEPDCDKSLFILNDTASTDRDLTYDVGLRGGTTDQEGEYAPGQNYYTTAKVLVNGNTVSLEKIN